MIHVNGTSYNLRIESINATANSLDGEGTGRDANGKLHRQVIGEFYTHDVKVESPTNSADVAVLAAFFLAITAPEESFDVAIDGVALDGMNEGATIEAYFGTGITRELRRITNAGTLWKDLSFSIIPMGPSRVP